MALTLQSISQLSTLSPNEALTSFTESYSNIFSEATTLVEVSYKENSNTNISSLNLDLKNFVQTLYNDLTSLLSAVSANIKTSLAGYLTQTSADDRYVKKNSNDPQTIYSELTFRENITCNGQIYSLYDGNDAINVPNSSINANAITANNINCTNIITANTITTNNSTVNSSFISNGSANFNNNVTFNGTNYAVYVKSKIICNTTGNVAQIIIAPNDDPNVYIKGKIQVDGEAALTANAAKYS